MRSLARLALLAGFGAASYAAPAAPRVTSQRDACAIGALILASRGSPGETTILDGARLATPFSPDPGDEVAAATVRAQPPSNLFAACPSLVSHMPPNVRWATREDIKDASRHGPPPPGRGSGPWRAIVWFSAPIFDQGKAFVIAETECTGLCGSGAVLTFSRAQRTGAWEQTGSRIAWVS